MAATRVRNKSLVVAMVNDTPSVKGGGNAYKERANYITFDRSSKRGLEADDSLFFMEDPSVDSFVQDIEIADAFVELLCKRYKNSKERGMMSKPPYVIQECEERCEEENQGFEWVRNNYEVSDPATVESWKKPEWTESNPAYNWEAVGDQFIVFKDIYKAYLDGRNSDSSTRFGRILTKHGVLPGAKKVRGKTEKVRVGVRELQDIDECY